MNKKESKIFVETMEEVEGKNAIGSDWEKGERWKKKRQKRQAVKERGEDKGTLSKQHKKKNQISRGETEEQTKKNWL